jgi:hypothetical protein
MELHDVFRIMIQGKYQITSGKIFRNFFIHCQSTLSSLKMKLREMDMSELHEENYIHICP